jgi:hypothetical protein
MHNGEGMLQHSKTSTGQKEQLTSISWLMNI